MSGDSHDIGLHGDSSRSDAKVDPADSTYELLEPRTKWPPWWRILVHIASGAAFFNPEGMFPAQIHEVQSRRTQEIVFSATTRGEIPFKEMRRVLAWDLAHLSRREFEKEYGILPTASS